jgi:4-hydroxy-2,2'-bipyrrole-5-carbaldehyde O-methyltransferase
MKLKTLMAMIRDGRFFLMLKLTKISETFYRACFISSGLREGIFDRLRQGPLSLEKLNTELGFKLGPQTLEAWLELGVKLGELKHEADGYALGSRFSRKVVSPFYDPQRAFLEEIVHLHHTLLTESPTRLQQGRKFTWSDTDGKLIARSSRVLEPFILDTMDQWVPRTGECDLLEVGCGSGVYIRYACRLNPLLKAVGLEMQPEVSSFALKNIRDWQLVNRVAIETADILNYQSSVKFDLIALHNNIYYFPEDQRVDLLRRLKSFLKPGGRLIVTTGCRNGGIIMRVLNLWSVMTEGAGALPLPDELYAALVQAGFQNIRMKNLMVGEKYYQFVAKG